MPVTRRTLLKTLGTSAGTLSLAGCLSLGEDDAPSGTDTPTDTRTTTSGPDPQPPPARDLFEGAPCPSFNDTDRTVCWHTHPEGVVEIVPSQPVFQPVAGNDEVETITFTLRNTRDAPIGFNPSSWAIKRHATDGWKHVAPDGVVKPPHELDPGNAYNWVLSRQAHPTPRESRTRYLTVNVENGTHAFVLTGTVLDTSPNTTDTTEAAAGTTIEWVTLFDVQIIYR